MKAPKYVANFDSASAMLRATARFLHGEDFPTLGMSPTALLKPYAAGVNLLPERLREGLYSVSGAVEGVFPRDLDEVDSEELARWIVSEYPEQREYPAVVIGSSNGAAVHLCAALGIPWIPQTHLVPVRRIGVDPADMRASLEWGAEHAPALLEANPDLQLHHMHDPNQDYLMIRYMSYFRVKRLRLGATLERFISESLPPGGTILLLDCGLRWPTVRVAERHFFQMGAEGGLEPEEYLRGSDRVAGLLERYDSDRRDFNAPEPDAERPEAEWGFEPALGEDVERFAAERGYRVQRIRFPGPQELSPLVAELYREWYREREIPARRLLAESFVLLEPWWTLRTGSVPFWMVFNVEPSARALERYLDEVDEPFDEIHLMLFSHGTESAGLAPIERWREILRRARTEGRFVGVDEEKFPMDFGSFGAYHTEVQKISARHRLPPPLPLERVQSLIERRGGPYGVRWQPSG